MDRWTFEVYVTDTLQAITENTAAPAAYYTEGKHGKAISRRWADLGRPEPPEETRTAEEIIACIKEKLEEVRQGESAGPGCDDSDKPGGL